MLRSIFSNWLAFLLIGIISFLITPFMIHRLGDFQFGIYTLAFSVAGYSDLLEQGIRSTLQRFVARLSGTRDREGTNVVFSTALALTCVVAVAVILICAGLSRSLPLFFKLAVSQRELFAWLLILLGLNVGVGFPAALLGSYLTGLQRFDLYNIVAIVRQVIRAGLIVLVLLRGHGMLAVAVCVLVSTIITLPLNWWLIRVVDTEVRFAFRLVRLGMARELLSFSMWMLLSNAGQFLRESTDSIVIGRVLGAALITPFTVAARFVNYFRPIIGGIVSPLLPRIAELDGQNRQADMQELFLRVTRISALVSLAVGALILLDGRSLLLHWVGRQYLSSYPVLVLLTIGTVVSLAQLGAAGALAAVGRHRAYGVWTLAEGVANLILSVYWARKYGIVGVALGTAVPLLAVKLVLQPWYVARVLKFTLWQYVREALARPVAVCILLLALCTPWGGFQAVDSIWRFLWIIAGQGVIACGLVFVIGLDRSDRRLAQRILSRVGERLQIVQPGSAIAALRESLGFEDRWP